MGHNGTEFVFPDDLEGTRNDMRLARHGKLRREFECRYVHRDGHPVPISWTGTAGEIRWPHPQNLPVGPLNNYGYEDEVVLLVDLTAPADAKPGTVPVKASANWLGCKEICIPEQGELDLALKVDAAEPAINDRFKPSFERARLMLPVSDASLKSDAGIAGRKSRPCRSSFPSLHRICICRLNCDYRSLSYSTSWAA